MIVVAQQARLENKVKIYNRSNVDIERMCSWCHDQFGQRFSIVDRETFGRNGVWQCLWDGSNTDRSYTFSFDNKTHANWFALRWSS